MAAVLLCAGVFASAASARFEPTGVVPVFCGNAGGPVYEIPSTTELKLRMTWAVKNSGQITKFLGGQKLVVVVYDDSDGRVLSSRTPSNPEYGNTTWWSAPYQNNIRLGDGTRVNVWAADYLAPTGVFIPAGETVRISYTLTANVKTDDGFGNVSNPFATISAGTTCTVTGV